MLTSVSAFHIVGVKQAALWVSHKRQLQAWPHVQIMATNFAQPPVKVCGRGYHRRIIRTEGDRRIMEQYVLRREGRPKPLAQREIGGYPAGKHHLPNL
jgi:hypothetical protein